MLIESDDLVTVSDIAAEHNVTRAAVSNWAHRHPDFPTPVVDKPKFHLWLRSEVDAWCKATGHGRFEKGKPRPWSGQLLRHG